MLKFSRISRSIIVVIYTLFICFITYLAISEKNVFEFNIWHAIFYIVAILLSVCIYQIIKRRLRGKMENQSVRRIYRFGYLAVILVVSRIIIIYFTKGSMDYFFEPEGIAGGILNGLVSITSEAKYAAVIVNTIITYVNCVIIKKIMLNIFDNDAIATMSSIMYILSPISLTTCLSFNTSIFNTLFILIGIYLLYLIHDEIIEYGLKSKKYLMLGLFLAIVVALDILFGGSILPWTILLLIFVFITDYIDKDRFDITKIKILSKIFKKKELIISKGIVVFIVVTILGIIINIISNVTGLSIYTLENTANIFLTTKSMYILTGAVVVIFELLSLVLKRKNETKAVLMKLATCIFGILSIYYMNSLIVFDALFSMTFLLSIGNVYYNREEKIKLLKSGM